LATATTRGVLLVLVSAAPLVQKISTISSMKSVGPCVIVSADDIVIAFFPINKVKTFSAIEAVIAIPAVDEVVALLTVDDVVAPLAVKGVSTVVPANFV
jgi:hypothetical protein